MTCCDYFVEIGRKVMINLFHKDKNVRLSDSECNNDNFEYVDNIVSNRFENALLKCSNSMDYERLRENWFDVSNPQIINGKTNGSGKVNGGVGIMHESTVLVLDEEFQLLGADDKLNNCELERVLSSSSNTSAVSVTVSNGLTSASREVPVTVGSNGMAVMMHQHNDSARTSSQLSVGTQKLEELAVKQSWLLIPMIQSRSRSLAEKDMSWALEKFESNSRNASSCLTPKSSDASDVKSLTDCSSSITVQNGNALCETMKYSSNEEQQHRTKPIFHSEEEEIVFLRSLGWEGNSEFNDDNYEGLTLQEILDFYEKYHTKLQL